MNTINNIKLGNFNNNTYAFKQDEYSVRIHSNCSMSFYIVGIFNSECQLIESYRCNTMKALKAFLSEFFTEQVNEYVPVFVVLVMTLTSVLSTAFTQSVNAVHNTVEAIKHFFDFETTVYTGCLIGFIPFAQSLLEGIPL